MKFLEMFWKSAYAEASREEESSPALDNMVLQVYGGDGEKCRREEERWEEARQPWKLWNILVASAVLAPLL